MGLLLNKSMNPGTGDWIHVACLGGMYKSYDGCVVLALLAPCPAGSGAHVVLDVTAGVFLIRYA